MDKAKIRGGLRCVAGTLDNESCTNNSHTEGISMHRFPKDPKITQKWTAFIKKKRVNFNSETYVNLLLCFDHFEANYYTRRFAGQLGGFEKTCGKNFLQKGAIPTVYLPSKTLPTKSPSKRAKRWLVRDAFMSTPEMPMEAGEESATDLEPTSAKATVLDDEYMEAQSSQTIYDDTTTDCEKSNKVMVTLKAVRKVVNRQRRNIISLNSKIKQQGSRMNYLRKKICSVKKASPVKLACSQTSNECGSTFGSEENESDFDEDTNWYKTEEDNEGEEQEEEVGCLIDSDVDSQDGDAIDGADATRGNIRCRIYAWW